MAKIELKSAAEIEELEQRYDPEMAFRHNFGMTKWLVVALLFLLSLFHYYTAGFGVLEHHWHVGVHLAFVLGLILLVYTAHSTKDIPASIAEEPSELQIGWPDVTKAAAASIFIAGMLGNAVGAVVFMGFMVVVHVSRRHIARNGLHGGRTVDHVFAGVVGVFFLLVVGQYFGVFGKSFWGQFGDPPAIRLNMAMMVLALVFESRRRVPVVLLLFAAAAYYYSGGLGGIGLANDGLVLVLVTSALAFAITLEPIVRNLPVLSPADLKEAEAKRGGGVPAYDWFLFVIVAISSMYVAVTYDGFFGVMDELNFRIGDPTGLDLLMGTAMVLIVVEAARRTSGIALPIITNLFVMYALFGNYFSYPMVHPGTTWPALIDHLYLKGEGVTGRPVFVIATYVFHFVLFGMVALRVGLGQLFIDIAHCVAGKYAGGPAKVSVLASGMMGMISGSSIANTVMTGSLTIPTMKRVGYKPHFAAAVEAAASTGGQITPPIMGSAAFLMIEFLEIPLRDIILAAIVPASMHYLGVMVMVHFEAKKLGLRGLRPDEMPVWREVLAKRWLTLIPFFLIIYMIFVGHTPYWAAFWSITAALAMGFGNAFLRWFLKTTMDIPEEVTGRHLGCDPINLKGFVDAFQMGGKYALSVGAAAATVGIIIGVLTVTGTPFNIATMVNNFASEAGQVIASMDVTGMLDVRSVTLFLTLIFVAISCIIMGAGLPTTATYLVLATMATPALAVLGVDALQTHFFVFYYGVLADITPPVALAAYAGATIAGANLMETGNAAFRLGAAKALVPFVFMYAPTMLLVIGDFDLYEFAVAFIGCALGVVMMGAALTGYVVANMSMWQRLLLGAAAILVIAPGVQSGLVGAAMAFPIVLLQFTAWKSGRRENERAHTSSE